MNHRLLCLLILFLLSACANKHEETACFHAVADDYTESISVNGTIQAVNSTFLKSPRLFLSTIIWIEEDGKHVKKGDTVCILEHPETQSDLDETLEELEIMEAQLERLGADQLVKLTMLQAEIENNNIQLSINSLDSVQKEFAPPQKQKLISLNQQKANILKRKLEKKYSAQETIGETEIRGLTSRLKQMENRIQMTQDKLNELILTAPKDGFLLRVEMPTMMFMSSTGAGSFGGKIAEGSSIWTNMNIIEIPNLDKMQILAELTENDYKKARDGQNVLIRVEAKNNLYTTGVLKRKMLTGRQQNRNSRIKMYDAIIDLDSCHKMLTPGMNAECEIIINDFKDTLVVPAIAVFEEKEEKYVYVKEDKKYRKTRIKTGNTNSTYCVVSSGLPADSYIALIQPPKRDVIKENRITEQESERSDSLDQENVETDTIQLRNQKKAFGYD